MKLLWRICTAAEPASSARAFGRPLHAGLAFAAGASRGAPGAPPAAVRSLAPGHRPLRVRAPAAWLRVRPQVAEPHSVPAAHSQAEARHRPQLRAEQPARRLDGCGLYGRRRPTPTSTPTSLRSYSPQSALRTSKAPLARHPKGHERASKPGRLRLDAIEEMLTSAPLPCAWTALIPTTTAPPSRRRGP